MRGAAEGRRNKNNLTEQTHVFDTDVGEAHLCVCIMYVLKAARESLVKQSVS